MEVCFVFNCRITPLLIVLRGTSVLQVTNSDVYTSDSELMYACTKYLEN